jgi:prepilin-type N-terminal cleavage/methylation domain-containing protein
MTKLAAKAVRGFTLIEMIIVITIIAVISVMAGQVVASGLKMMLTAQQVVDADWQAKLALESMVREIRNIRSRADMTTTSSTTLAFNDINGDAITYAYSGGALTKNSQIIASGVASFSFTYYDVNYNTTTTPANVAIVYMQIGINADNSNTTYQTQLYLRNYLL